MNLFRRKQAPPLNLPEDPFASIEAFSRFFSAISLGLLRGSVDLKTVDAVVQLMETWSAASKIMAAREDLLRSKWIQSTESEGKKEVKQ